MKNQRLQQHHEAVDGLVNLFTKANHDLALVQHRLEKEFQQIYPNNVSFQFLAFSQYLTVFILFLVSEKMDTIIEELNLEYFTLSILFWFPKCENTN